MTDNDATCRTCTANDMVADDVARKSRRELVVDPPVRRPAQSLHANQIHNRVRSSMSSENSSSTACVNDGRVSLTAVR